MINKSSLYQTWYLFVKLLVVFFFGGSGVIVGAVSALTLTLYVYAKESPLDLSVSILLFQRVLVQIGT